MATTEGLNGEVLNIGTNDEVKIIELPAAKILKLSNSSSGIINSPFLPGRPPQTLSRRFKAGSETCMENRKWLWMKV